jgi:hypothetical protein
MQAFKHGEISSWLLGGAEISSVKHYIGNEQVSSATLG